MQVDCDIGKPRKAEINWENESEVTSCRGVFTWTWLPLRRPAVETQLHKLEKSKIAMVCTGNIKTIGGL